MGKLIATLLVVVIFNTTKARFPDPSKTPFVHNITADLGDSLILTSYLEQGKLNEARVAARVTSEHFEGISSYAGYFNVDKKNHGSLFFWFFPSQNNYLKDPVILWLQGGPGTSSLLGLFVENGPFIVWENGTVSSREDSWTKDHSVLYIDQPVGTGYSYTYGAIPTSQYTVADHVYSALTQFFTVFPEIQNNSFFIAGESYAGKYIPAIGNAINRGNPNAKVKINLQGLLIGNGLSDPINQFNYGDLLYQLGLIDDPTRKDFKKQQQVIAQSIEAQSYAMATRSWLTLVSEIGKITGLKNLHNFIKDEDDTPTSWQQLVVRKDVRKAIHVGNRDYNVENYNVYHALFADITESVAPWVTELLDNYRVLIFNGQLDIIVGYSLTANYLEKLKFSAANEYKAAKRNIWYVDRKVAGYVKTAGNLTEVLVRDAGHMVPMEQPKFALDLVYKFTRNKSIANNLN